MDRLNQHNAPWLFEPPLQQALQMLGADGEQARIAGGAVRNALLGLSVNDIDIATTLTPDQVVARAANANMKTIPTGIDHGTVTLVHNEHVFEVTTLRADTQTDGRHAKVVFGRDWQTDAERRDFTINGMFADADGTIHDFVGGLEDLANRTIRFIGDADQRITEDYLRALRFYRIFAWYGSGRPDAEGIKATARHKKGLEKLSTERIWSELKKLLTAADPARALLWMRQTGVLTRILPESENWGIDTIAPLIEAEQANNWSAEPLLRLAAIIPPRDDTVNAIAARLKLSNVEARQLLAFTQTPSFDAETTVSGLNTAVYNHTRGPIIWRLKLAACTAQDTETNAKLIALIEHAQSWQCPTFPLKGADLVKQGFEPGPEIGRTLKALETAWIDSDFTLTRDQLLGRFS